MEGIKNERIRVVCMLVMVDGWMDRKEVGGRGEVEWNVDEYCLVSACA